MTNQNAKTTLLLAVLTNVSEQLGGVSLSELAETTLGSTEHDEETLRAALRALLADAESQAWGEVWVAAGDDAALRD